MAYMKLKDICCAKNSNIKQNSLNENEGKYPIYGASGFIKNINYYQVDKEYISVIKDGSGVGKVFINPPYSSIIGTMQYIFPNNNYVITKYLYYYLKHVKLYKYSVGMAIPHIYFKDYKNEDIYIPNLKQQKEIVNTLDTIVNIIKIKNSLIKKYDELVKSQFISYCEVA